jgi:DNA-binding GntR family transcriptional regulator
VLRDAIRQRLLPPGSPLIQKAIADALGVSRVPVREALQNLAAEGLVTFADEGGARVSSLSADDVDELYSLRLLLEPVLAPAIVQRITATELASLDALVAEMDACGDDLSAWANANYAFHDALYRAAGRRHHYRLARQLLTLVEPYSRVAVFHLKGREQSQLEHHRMLECMRAQDSARLRDVITTHLSRAHRDLLAYARRDAVPPHSALNVSQAAQAFSTRLLGAAERPA